MRGLSTVVCAGVTAAAFSFFLLIKNADRAAIVPDVPRGTAGVVALAVGDVEIERAVGWRVIAKRGSPLNTHDAVETGPSGAAQIVFADKSAFALGRSARLEMSDYVYDVDQQKGRSVFDFIRGVFIYTSGLIAKHDVADVEIRTPVGSIGIRGTVVAGDIRDNGDESKITIIDGAVALINNGGTLELRDKMRTARIADYGVQPADAGVLTPEVFAKTYRMLAAVAAPLMRDVGGGFSIADMQPYQLMAFIGEDMVTETSYEHIALKGSLPEQKIFPIYDSKPIQLRIELKDPEGKVQDVTRDRRTIYSVMRGSRLSVSPDGIVTTVKPPYNQPMVDEDEENTVLIVFSALGDDGAKKNKGALATVIVRFRIQ